MSDTNAAPQAPAGGSGAPANQPAAQPAQTAQPQAAQPIGITSEQLSQRLAEERGKGAAALLADLGFQKPEDAKAFFKSAKDMQQAQMSEQEKLAQRVKELEPHAQRIPLLEQRIKAVSDREFATLPEAARTAIDKQAGGDPEKRLTLIELMRDSGLLPQAGATSQAAPQAAPAAAPLLTTAPPANQPPPGNAPTAYQKWQSLKSNGRHMAADAFFALHQQEITKTTPQGA